MPKKLKRSIRLPLKEDGTGGEVILPKDKKWESKLNDAGLSKRDWARMEKAGHIINEGNDDEDGDEESGPVAVHELADSLASIDDIGELRKMRRRDKRVSAKSIYDKRIKELQEAEKGEKEVEEEDGN